MTTDTTPTTENEDAREQEAPAPASTKQHQKEEQPEPRQSKEARYRIRAKEAEAARESLESELATTQRRLLLSSISQLDPTAAEEVISALPVERVHAMFSEGKIDAEELEAFEAKTLEEKPYMKAVPEADPMEEPKRTEAEQAEKLVKQYKKNVPADFADIYAGLLHGTTEKEIAENSRELLRLLDVLPKAPAVHNQGSHPENAKLSGWNNAF